jgi:ribonucleoside-diphosphate reductase alpha chain
MDKNKGMGGVSKEKKDSKDDLFKEVPAEKRQETDDIAPDQLVSEALEPFMLKRHFTTKGESPYNSLRYVKRSSRILNPDGSIVFALDDAEVPEEWSQLATDILVSKYFRKAGVPGTGNETSIKQVVHRIAHTLRTEGEKLRNYFIDENEPQVFEDELVHILLTQKGAFNSPVWFNLGLYHEYGIEGQGGAFFFNSQTDKIEETKNAYQHPQCSACFIQSVKDDLMDIFQLVKNEARLFKYGSGTGTNFSKIRSREEKLSGGGTSSGLMSFLEVLDRAAGATKSGGTTRRAAKMVILDADHPEIVDFISWKKREEEKARLMAKSGITMDEAIRTVSGQNANNSVRVTDEFMEACEKNGTFSTRDRVTGEEAQTYKAKDLSKMIAEAAWECGDPGLQFDTTINKWHTCKASGRINASNPCSEYMFLDDSSCNLASINLLKYLREDGSFDIEGFKHTVSILIMAQEILVDLASYPTETIAQNSHDFRPLGLGYANIGGLLMVSGIPYDSPKGFACCSAITSLMTGHAYTVSAHIAERKGPFAAYSLNKDSMLDVIKMHRTESTSIDTSQVSEELATASRQAWDDALLFGMRFGYRNAQASVLAPTGTIGMLMDCDTTGIEPDFTIVKFKKLAGGGYFKIANQSVEPALRKLGYPEQQIGEMLDYLLGTFKLEGTPFINPRTLAEKGFTTEEISKVESALSRVVEITQAFSLPVLGEACFQRFGVTPLEAQSKEFSLLAKVGFKPEEIEEASKIASGRGTLEGAPYFKEEHQPIFDCANKCGKYGKRFIAPLGHIRMMSAAQPFISGAISKTVNLPGNITAEEIDRVFAEAWKRGVKAIAVYRDGSKMLQPLSDASSEKKEGKEKAPQEAVDLWRTPLQRRRLPKKRKGFTQEARVGGQKIYLRTGEYEDGRLGEIFVDVHKEGASFRSLMNCFAIAISLGLQYGVPLEEYVDCFTFTSFEPRGVVNDHPNIKHANSMIDYLFRVIALEYLERTDLVQVKPQELTAESEATKILSSPTASRKDIKEAEELLKTESKLPVYKLAESSVASQYLGSMMGDAPFCSICGHLTVRNGACYKCLNCGNSLGCS